MENEKFQDLILEHLARLTQEFTELKSGQQRLENGQQRLENRQEQMDTRMERMETRMERMESRLDVVCEQTAILMEFRTEVTNKLDAILEDNKSIHEIIGEHEIAIRTFRRRPV